MPSENLFELFRSRFPADLDAPFIETMDGQIRTYGELEAESARLARLFSAQGVQPGDRVMVQVAKSPPVLFLYLACLRAGFIYLPLNTGYRQRELEYFFANAAPRVIVCNPESYALWRTLDPAGACVISCRQEVAAGRGYPLKPGHLLQAERNGPARTPALLGSDRPALSG